MTVFTKLDSIDSTEKNGSSKSTHCPKSLRLIMVQTLAKLVLVFRQKHIGSAFIHQILLLYSTVIGDLIYGNLYLFLFRCKIVDKHLEILAPQHIECKFMKIDAEKSKFLTDRLKVRVLPTLVLLRDNKTVCYFTFKPFNRQRNSSTLQFQETMMSIAAKHT